LGSPRCGTRCGEGASSFPKLDLNGPKRGKRRIRHGVASICSGLATRQSKIKPPSGGERQRRCRAGPVWVLVALVKGLITSPVLMDHTKHLACVFDVRYLLWNGEVDRKVIFVFFTLFHDKPRWWVLGLAFSGKWRGVRRGCSLDIDAHTLPQ